MRETQTWVAADVPISMLREILSASAKVILFVISEMAAGMLIRVICAMGRAGGRAGGQADTCAQARLMEAGMRC